MNAFIGDFVFNDDSLYEYIFLIFWFQFINVFLGENCIRIYLVYVHFAFLVLNMLLRIIKKKTMALLFCWRATTRIRVAPYIYWLAINVC